MSEGPNTPAPGQQPGEPAPGQPPAGGPPPGQQPPPPGQPVPQAPQAPQQPAVGVGQPADLTNRFLAKLIDWVVLIIAIMIVGAILGAIFFAGAVGGTFGTGGGILFGVVSTVISTAIVLGYFSFLESKSGQTLGKMLLKLQVQQADGSTPTMEQAVKRNAYLALWLLSVIPFIGWLLSWVGLLVANIFIAVTINNNATTRQGWHDEFAGGTKVIKIG